MKILILFSCLLLNNINSLAFEKKYPVSAIPSGLRENAKAVLRVSEETFEVLSVGKGIYTVKYAYTIFDKNGQQFATLVVPYDNKLRSVNYIKGTLYNALGEEVNKLKKSDIRDVSGSGGGSFVDDNRLKIAEFNITQFPFTVEFEYELVYDGLMFYPNWEPYPYEDVAVESSFFKAILPKELKFRYKEVDFEKITTLSEQSSQGNEDKLQTAINRVKISNLKEKQIYTWQATHLPIYKSEAFASHYDPMVYIAPTDFEIEGYKGDMSTWQTYGKFINQLNANRDELPEATKVKLKELVANIPDVVGKVKKIYEYLQSKTRYVGIQLGIGGWQPFPAKYVDEKSYGDCKALSNYTKAMLKAIGIESYYTLIYAGKTSPPLFTDFSTARFNHAILCVPIAKDTLWLECTSQTEAFAYASPDNTGDRNALIITPDGGKVVRTTRYKKQDNLLDRQAVIKIDVEGNASVEVNTNYRAFQEGIRKFLVEESKEDQKKWLYEHLEIPSFDIQEFSLTRQKDRLPITSEKLKLQITKYASKSGKRMFIPLNLLNRWDRVPENSTARKSEVYLNGSYDFVDIDTLQYQLPEGYEVEYQPEPINLKSKFGEYQVTCKKEGNILTYVRKLEMNRGKFPKEAYSELIEFFKNIAKNDKTKLVLVNKG